MKKQYLISLLGLAALSISFGNGFSSMPSSSTNNVASEEATSTTSNFSEEELNTLEEYENEFPEYSVEQVSMSHDHSGAVVNDGTGEDGDHLYMSRGQHVGENPDQELVTEFEGKNIEQIALDEGGYSYSVIADGDLYTWGDNKYGQLGLGDYDYRDTPTKVTTLPEGEVEQVSMGRYHSAAVVNDGTGTDGDHLYTWGDNGSGKLGLGDEFTESKYNTPQKVTAFEGRDIEQIDLGSDDSGALVDGEVYMWGSNRYGQVGTRDQPSELYFNTPQELEYVGQFYSSFTQISLGGDSCAAVMDGWRLFTWGRNDYGQLGVDTGNTNSTLGGYPKEVTDLPEGEVEQISMGGFHSAAVVEGELYTWGGNGSGQLGLGDEFTEYEYYTPQKVTALEGQEVEKISFGGNSSAAIVDGSIYTWGENVNGQLGLNNHVYYNTPQLVWEPPYINTSSISSSATLIGDDLDRVQVKYEFETNLDIQDVTILLEDNNNPEEITVNPIEVNSSPTKSLDNENEYQGKITIDKNLVPGADYIYTISPNYLNHFDELDTFTLAKGEISNSTTSAAPTIKDINSKNSETDWVGIDFDLDLGHDQSNIPYTLEEIIIDDNSHGEQRIYTEDGTPIAGEEVDGKFDINDQGEGSLEVIDLTPDIAYNWHFTFVLSSPWEVNNEKIYYNLEEFSTASAYEKSSIDNKNEVAVMGNTEASVDYKIELGKNSHGQKAEIKKVEWKTINSKSNETIAASDSPNIDGTLTATGLDNNTTYNTVIVATMEDGTETNEKVLNSFTTDSLKEESTISADPVNVISSTEASVIYNVEHGKDIDGQYVHVVRVKWMDGNTKLDSSKQASSTLTTSNLDPYTTYEDTTLVAEMSDGTSTDIITLKPFKTLSEQELSTINADSVDVISSTEASIDYNIILGVDHYGDDVTIENVKWMYGDIKLDSSTSEGLTGTLTAKDLDPNTTYSNTTIVATMSDKTSTDEITLDPFTTDSGAKQSTITVEEPQPTGITSASVKYEVNSGKDVDANDIFVINVQWMNGTQELASSRRGATTLTTDQLKPDQLYDETYLIATMSDGSKTEKTDVDPFLTWTNAEESTITASDVEVISPTEARIAYNVTPGLNTYGNDISVDEVKWMDGDEKLASSTNKANGVLTTNRLESNQEYNETFLIAYMSDGTTATIDVNDFNDKNVTPEVDQLHHVQVDYDDDILDVKGSIDTNGAAINDIYFVKDGQRIHTDYLEGEFNQVSNSDNVTYDMWTKEYLGEKNLDGSADLEGYSIAIEYGNELFEEPISLATTDDHSSIAEDQAIEKELGYLLGEEGTSFSAAAISGMTIGAILIIGLIGAGGFGGYYLYKKHQA